MDNRLLEKVAMDVCTRSIMLIADDGSDRIVECETVDEFMNVIEFVRKLVPEDRIVFAEVATLDR